MKTFESFLAEAVQSKNDLQAFLYKGSEVKNGMYIYYKSFSVPGQFNIKELLNLFGNRKGADVSKQWYSGDSGGLPDFGPDLDLGIRFILLYDAETSKTWIVLWPQHILHDKAISILSKKSAEGLPDIDWKSEYQKTQNGQTDRWLMFLGFVLSQSREFGTNMHSKAALDRIKSSPLLKSIV